MYKKYACFQGIFEWKNADLSVLPRELGVERQEKKKQSGVKT